MRFLKIILISICPFFSVIKAQNVQIEMDFENAKDSTIIWFNKPLDSNSNNYWENADSTMIVNNFFKKDFLLNNIGIIEVNASLENPRLNLIVESNNRIKVKVKKNNNSFVVDFEGGNASGLQEFNNNFIKFAPLVRKTFEETQDADSFLLKLAEVRIKFFEPYDDLLLNKKITTPFYEMVSKEADLRILFTCNLLKKLYKSKPSDTSLGLINRLNQILERLDLKYDPFDSKYEKNNARIVAIVDKSVNISEGILKGTKQNIGLWQEDNDFFNYAPIKCQELIKVREINTKGFETANCSFAKFKKTFPNSTYLKVLEKLNTNSKLITDLQPYSLLNYSNNFNEINLVGTKKYDGIKELIKEKYKGKAVFVDLWASYCAPCKKEFTYSAPLHTFLKNNNIELLYVYVDFIENGGVKWRRDIQTFKLDGTHYFASNTIFESLKNLLGEKNDISIPRYLLFNSKGDLLIKNTKKPSEGQSLYDEIFTALK